MPPPAAFCGETIAVHSPAVAGSDKEGIDTDVKVADKLANPAVAEQMDEFIKIVINPTQWIG